MKTKDLEKKVLNLESAMMDMQRLLEVINERISHNGRGIDLLIDRSHDAGDDTTSDNDGGLSSLIEQISELDSSTNDGIRELLSIAKQVGVLRFEGDYRFDEGVLQIWNAACDAGFNMYHDHLFVSISKAMMNGIE